MARVEGVEVGGGVTFQMTTGHETWRSSSSKFYVFAVKFPGREQAEEGLSDAAKDSKNPHAVFVRKNSTAASAAGRKVELGSWTSCLMSISEGTILKVVAQMSAPAFGDRTKMLQKLIRARSTGPLIKISLNRTGQDAHDIDAGDAPEDPYIFGRFDLLTLEEAAEWGVTIIPRKQHLFLDTFEDVLTYTVQEPEKEPIERAAQKLIENKEGKHELVTIRRKARVIE